MTDVPATEAPAPAVPDELDIEVVIDMVRKILEDYPQTAAIIASTVNAIQQRLKASTDAAIEEIRKNSAATS